MVQARDKWARLRPELLRMQREGEPVRTLVRRNRNAILEVGADYVLVMSEAGRGKPRKVLAQEINSGDLEWYTGRRRIIAALRSMADNLGC